MTSSEEVLEASVSSDGIRPDDGMAFKPPSRPGASLRGRKSAAALLSGVPVATSSPSKEHDEPPLPAPSNPREFSRSHSPTSSLDGYDAAASSVEAQLVSATQAARSRLEGLGRQNENQTTAVGLLGHDLLKQRSIIESLKEELREELQRLQQSDGRDSEEGFERIKTLTEKIDAETMEMATHRKNLIAELISSGEDDVQANRDKLPSSSSSNNFTPTQSYAFLASDPSANRYSTSNGSITGQNLSSSRSSDRRARNAAAPSSISDHSLVNQLQEGLVSEIRRLQAILLQRDQQLKANEETIKKADEELATWRPKALSLMEQEDAIKQENWDLQVRCQGTEEQLEEERATIRKLETEKGRVTRELAKVRETADERKAQLEGQAAELESLKTTRETEIALARKDKASYLREQSDLQAELQKYKTEALRLERANMSHSGSRGMISIDNALAGDESTDSVLPPAAAGGGLALGVANSAGEASEDGDGPHLATKTARERELLDLRGKLALAHKKTGKDSAEKRKLREQNEQLRHLLQKAGLDAPNSSDVESSDEESESIWVDEAESKSGGKTRTMRIPKSSTRPNIASRFGLTPSISAQTVSEVGEDSFEDASQSGFGEEEGSEDGEVGNAEAARKKDRRRSTLRPNNRFSRGSPLAHSVSLPQEEKDDDSIEEPTKRLPASRRAAAAGQRYVSDVVVAAALGDELNELNDATEVSGASLRAADQSNEGGSIVATQPERNLSEEGVQTEEMLDLVTPALAAQQAEHEEFVAALQQTHQTEHEQMVNALEQAHQSHLEETIASLQASHQSKHEAAIADVRERHKVHLDNLSREHEEVVAALKVQHKTRVDELVAAHSQSLQIKDGQSSEYVAQLERAHETALSEMTATHAAALASALAVQKEQHEAAMAEARSRHTQTLADHVERLTSALSQAEARHEAVVAEREKVYKAETEKREHSHRTELSQRDKSHRQALEDKDREHQSMIEDINSTNDAYLVQRDAAYGAALKERDDQVVKARAEVQRLRKELEDLTAELAEARRQLSVAIADGENKTRALEEARNAHLAALAAVTAELEALRHQQQRQAEQVTASVVESRRTSVSKTESRPHSELFSDAVEPEPESENQPEEVTQQDAVATAMEPEHGVRKVVLADLRESGTQTDDENWARIQQERFMLRPSSISVARPGKTTVGAGGLTVLGGYATDKQDGPESTLYTPEELNVALQRRSAADSLPPPDTSKPPVLAVPPPPSMPPPTPARPTSPPPPKLLARASFGAQRSLKVLGSPGETSRPASRISNVGAPPSSYRRRGSKMEGAGDDARSIDSNATGYLLSRPHKSRRPSGTSLASETNSVLSSQTSFTESDAHGNLGDETLTGRRNQPRRSGRGSNVLPGEEATDPVVIQAITQTMIGEYLYKYTRRTMRTDFSDKRHRRYFWVHPYTKMVYWTLTDPGGRRTDEGTSKAACILGVSVVEDANSSPPGLYYQSIVIKTAARDIKVTAENKERHDVWLNALGYLVNRGDTETAAAADSSVVAESAATPSIQGGKRRTSLSRLLASPGRSLSSLGRLKSTESLPQRPEQLQHENDSTPKGRSTFDALAGSSYRTKRRDTAAREYLQQQQQQQQQSRARTVSEFGTDESRTRSRSTFGRKSNILGGQDVGTSERLKTAEEMLEENEREAGFEGLDNVRACCGGAHDVGSLAHKQHQQRKTTRRPGSSLGITSSDPHTPRASDLGLRGPGTSRPSSRLSNVSSSLRTRGSSSASNSTYGARDRDRERENSSPIPPQLGPLNLNTPRNTQGRSKPDPSKGNHQKNSRTETFASLFDLPTLDSNDGLVGGEEGSTPKANTLRSDMPMNSTPKTSKTGKTRAGGRSNDQSGSVRSTR